MIVRRLVRSGWRNEFFRSEDVDLCAQLRMPKPPPLPVGSLGPPEPGREQLGDQQSRTWRGHLQFGVGQRPPLYNSTAAAPDKTGSEAPTGRRSPASVTARNASTTAKATNAEVQIVRSGPAISAPNALIYGHFRPPCHLMAAACYRRARSKAFRIWRQETCVHNQHDTFAVASRCPQKRLGAVNLAMPPQAVFPLILQLCLHTLRDYRTICDR